MASTGREDAVVLAWNVDLHCAVKPASPVNHVASEFGLDVAWKARVNQVAFAGLAWDGLHHHVEKAPRNHASWDHDLLDGAAVAPWNSVVAFDHHDGADTAPLNCVAGNIGHQDGLDVEPTERVQAGDLLGVAAFACLDDSCETAADLAAETGPLAGVVFSMEEWVHEGCLEDVGRGLGPSQVAVLQNEGWFHCFGSW